MNLDVQEFLVKGLIRLAKTGEFDQSLCVQLVVVVMMFVYVCVCVL